MKAIINGLRYDTDKAIKIGEGGSDGYASSTDFHYWSAGLYRTPRSGRYFLAGHGGPMTRWAKAVGNNGSTGSSGIVPMSLEEAREWAERYLAVEEVETGFADAIEDA
ncbi:hypothetical protein [Rhodoblastus sp.]|uniref:hypothetical protein n=1 Tax=Rhodoblastus sp. TaxID=1962975 RepID=UPI003FC0A869